jgi:hypothetical protein
MCVSDDEAGYSKAYAHLMGFCRALESAPRLPFARPDEDCHAPVTDPAAALASLRQDFPDEVLQRAGILASNGSGFELDHGLYEPSTVLIALRKGPSNEIHDVLTPHGCLSGTVAVLQILEDNHTRECLEDSQWLLATSSLEEAVGLRSLGLAATLGTDLEKGLKASELRALGEIFGNGKFTSKAILRQSKIRAPGIQITESPASGLNTAARIHRKADPEIRGRHLVLVGWSPLSGSRECPDAILRSAAFLAGIQKFFGPSLERVSFWRPARPSFEKIMLAMKVRNPPLIRESMAESLREDCFDATRFANRSALLANDPPEAPTDYIAARDRFLQMLRQPDSGGFAYTLDNASRDYRTFVDQDLTRPLLDWALRQTNPIVRNAAAQLANTAALLHEIMPRLQHQMSQEVKPKTRPEDEHPYRLMLEQALRLVARYGALMQQISQWQQSSGAP